MDPGNASPMLEAPQQYPQGQRLRRLAGFALVGFSAVGFGTLAIFGRYAYGDGMDTLTFMALRFTLAAAVMAILVAARHERLPRGSALLRLMGMGAVGYVAQAFAYLSALKYASAGLVALLLYLYPVFVAVLSALLLRERVSRLKALALGLAVVGTGLTVGPASGQALGIVLAVAAAAIYSAYILVGSAVLRQASAVPASEVIFASAGVMSAVLMTIEGPHMPGSSIGWLAVGGTVIFATVVGAGAFLMGMERIGPTNAAMLSTLEPVVTVVLAAMLFGERLTAVALLGGGMILVAVVLLARGELQRRDAPMG